MPNKAAAGKGAKTTGQSQRRSSSDAYCYVRLRGRVKIGSVSHAVARSIKREAAMAMRCLPTARELPQSAGSTQAVQGLLTFYRLKGRLEKNPGGNRGCK